jgi:hypothetical protein
VDQLEFHVVETISNYLEFEFFRDGGDHEFAFFRFVNTLSPINPVKDSHTTQGYIIGNGVTNEKIDGNALIPFVHGMGLCIV